MTQLFLHGWNVDSILEHLAREGASVEEDNSGQIVLYTDLFLHSDGSLHDAPENE